MIDWLLSYSFISAPRDRYFQFMYCQVKQFKSKLESPAHDNNKAHNFSNVDNNDSVEIIRKRMKSSCQ